jgi:hypothetical protein
MLWLALAVSAVAFGLSFDVFTFTATYDDIYRGGKIIVTFVLPMVWLWWGVLAAIAWFFIQLGAAVLGGASYHGRYLGDELFHVVLRAAVGLAFGLLVRWFRARWSSLRFTTPSKDPNDYR